MGECGNLWCVDLMLFHNVQGAARSVIYANGRLICESKREHKPDRPQNVDKKTSDVEQFSPRTEVLGWPREIKESGSGAV